MLNRDLAAHRPFLFPGRRRALGKVLVAAGIAVAGLLVLGACAVYAAPPASPLAHAASRLAPYPAALVGWQIVTMAQYLDARAARAAYAQATPNASAATADDLLGALINRRLVARIGARLGVRPDPAAADALLARMTASSGGGAALENQLKQTYGWDLKAFRAEVVEPAAYADQVQGRVLADAAAQAPARAAADQALARLEKGEAFVQVAQAVNDPRGTLASDGDIGYRAPAELPAAWAAAVAALKPGGHTGVVEESDRFVLLSLADRIGTGADQQVRLNVILVPKRPLDDLVAAEETKTFVWRFVRP